jgi:hypothetical protein
MKKTLAKKFLAYHRIQRVLNSDPLAVASSQLLTNAKTGFDARLNALDGIKVPEPRATKPNTADKNKLLEKASKLLLPVCDGVALYAKEHSNMELAGLMPPNISSLVAGNEVTQLMRFWSVLEAAKSVLPADLLPYGVSAAQLSDLENTLTVLDEKVGSPRSAIDARLAKRQRQQDAFVQLDDFLKQTLDRAVRNRQPQFPEFVAAYFAARKLHDLPSQRLEQELTALSTETGNPTSSAASTSALKEALAPLANMQPAQNGVAV